MPRLITVIFCLWCLVTAKAQQPLQYSFTHYSSSSGLLSNQVNTIVQDSAGFIWAGTTDGLQRFDGNRYISFRHRENDPYSIPSNPVWQLLVDKKGNLWVLLADGRVGIFDTHSLKFREIKTVFKKPVSPNTFIKRLITDESGNIFYLMGGTEVITWNEKTGVFSFMNNFFTQEKDWNIADFIQQPGTQKYWISLEQGGLAIYDKSTGQLSYAGHNPEREPLIEQYATPKIHTHLFFDRENRFWSVVANTYPYIFCYDLKKSVPLPVGQQDEEYIKEHHEIKGFLEQGDGSIWIYGFLVFAKCKIPENRFQFIYNGYQNEKSITYEMIHCLFEDREKNIWVATDNNGIYRYNPATEYFTNVHHFNRETGKMGDTRITSFAFLKSGTLLAATDGEGLYAYDKNLNPVPLNIPGLPSGKTKYISTLCASKDGNTLWLASGHGIYAIDLLSHKTEFFNPPLIKNQSIRQMAVDKQGILWLGTENSGIYQWNFSNAKEVNKGLTAFSGFPAVPVNKITIDSKGFLWIATPETGAYVIDPVQNKMIMHFSDRSESAFKLPEAGVSSILEYDDSTMLIGTATRLFIFNRVSGQSEIFGHGQQISGFIAAVEKDKQGLVWITSSNGLYRINIRKKITLIMNRTDGIDNEHFIQSASLVLPDGRMVFGTTNHFIAFDPNMEKISHSFPQIHFTEVKVKNKALAVDSLLSLPEIELGYQDNSIQIEFSPLVYNSVFLIKYKMDGLDKDWVMTDGNNQAIYSYLPGGEYTFMMKVIDDEGNESPRISQIKIRVIPPFWKTIWFYSLVFLFLSGILFRIDRERTRRKADLQKMRSEIADDLHQEVNIALSNINILSEMANLKAEKEPQKSKEYIEQIHSKSNNIITAMDDMLWTLKPENDSMAKTIARLSEHIDAMRNKFGLKINLLADRKIETLKPDMKLRKNILWLIKGGITSVVRSGAKDIDVHITSQRQSLIYTLEFDSTGLNTQQMNNLLQRQELTGKVQAVGGVLNARIQNKRSVIELIIPMV